jgi:hypothetical protein
LAIVARSGLRGYSLDHVYVVLMPAVYLGASPILIFAAPTVAWLCGERHISN